MNSLIVSLAVIAIQSAQQGSLLREVVPNPTGRNGYEDFLSAIDALGYLKDEDRRLPIDFYLRWSPDAYERLLAEAKRPPGDISKEELEWHEAHKPRPADLDLAKRLDALDSLEVKREMVTRFKAALTHFKTGLGKQVWAPTRKRSLFDDLPELLEFRKLGQFLDAAAVVSFADGKPNEAAGYLIDSMTFATLIREQSLMHSTVAQGVNGMALATIEKHLDSLPLAASKRLSQVADEYHFRNEAVTRLITNEMATSIQSIIDIAFDPKMMEEMDEEDPESRHLIAQLRALTPQRRANLERLIRIQGQEHLQKALVKLNRPESEWTKSPADPPEEDSDRVPKTLEEAVISMSDYFYGSDDAALSSIALSRCQFRLLWLHAKVIQHRWEKGALPNSLSDVADKSRISDPLSGGEFAYERVGFHGFRIYSRGSAETGEVDLRHRRQRTPSGGYVPPPSPEPSWGHDFQPKTSQ
jgi:hypothetical protein